ncbi:MAG: ankyrin repeat domain-containing protein [Candidatus Zixiibacteriota bacterium]|nr:MAG: ankyrin repeat domain-containing protein [candidate division Zixibacteria bacterium]
MKTAIRIVMLLSVLSHVASSQEIFDAIRNGDLDRVKELVERDSQLIKARTADQSSLLLVAVSVSNKPIAEYLIEKGADVNVANASQWTPLFYAQSVEFAELLLENGADIDFGIPDYPPVLHLLWSGHQEVAEHLLEKGASIPGAESQYGVVTAIHAIKTGCVPYAEKALGKVIDPSYVSEGGSNLLHFAASGTTVELVEKLIGFGVSLKKKNIYGLTPLHNAVMQGNTEIVRLSINKGADINSRTADGRSAYNIALEEENDEIVQCLLSSGADTNPQEFPVVNGEYMGQLTPGNKAIPFAPGLVSGQHSYHGSIVFTANRMEMYWSVEVLSEMSNSIFWSRLENGAWTQPEFFSKGDVPFISPDGRKMFYVLLKETDDERCEVIMARDRAETGWSEPYELPENVNSIPRIHWQVSVDRQGNLYYGADFGAGDNIYYSEYENGIYADPKRIEMLDNVNAFSPYIAPDGSYMIVSIEREGERMALMFRRNDGNWTEPVDIAEYIGREMGYCPIVTHDSKYLFFLSGLERMYAPFWVNAGFIEELRPKE